MISATAARVRRALISSHRPPSRTNVPFVLFKSRTRTSPPPRSVSSMCSFPTASCFFAMRMSALALRPTVYVLLMVCGCDAGTDSCDEETNPHLAELDHILVLERRARDLLSIDQHAVSRAEIRD